MGSTPSVHLQSRINNLEAEEELRRTMMGTLRGQLEATQAENKRLQTRIAQLETQHQVRGCGMLRLSVRGLVDNTGGF